MVIANYYILIFYCFLSPWILKICVVSGGSTIGSNLNYINSGGSNQNGGSGNINSGGSSHSRSSSNSNSNNEQLPPHQQSTRIVHTRNGAISGVILQLEGRHLDSVEAFRGIPYASPPVGVHRFMPPVSAAQWSGVRRADR